MNKLFAIGLMVFSSVAFSHSSHHGGSAHMPAVDTAHAKVSATLAVSDCWVRSLPAPAPSAAYFIVKNTGDNEALLQGAASSTYGMVMLHQTTHQGGMSRMSETHDIVIPPGGQLEFKPGGYHAMLEKPVAAPAIGSTVAMDFVFSSGEKAVAQCEVKPANAQSH